MWKVSYLLCLVAIILTHSLVNSYYDDDFLEKDEIIDAVNNANTTWKAGRNFHPSLKREYSKILLGYKKDPNTIELPILQDLDDDIELPESFDAREKWRYCTALQTVRDQGSCGSCWAVASASAFTDRLCIATKGQFNGQLSAAELMSCDSSDHGCHGGDSMKAFRYFETHGIVTGGDYRSHEGCQPYPLQKCNHLMRGIYDWPNCTIEVSPTPKCLKTCTNKEYKSHSFQRDLHFIEANSSFLIRGNVRQMQREIYRHGPLVAGFDTYEDFFNYQTGVYRHTSGAPGDGHMVKVIGWGVEDGTDYWLVANSWNEKWGRLNGFFKMRRGTNECGFENDVVGGMPKVNHGF